MNNIYYGNHIFLSVFQPAPSSQRATGDCTITSQPIFTQNANQSQQFPDQSISSSSLNEPPNDDEAMDNTQSKDHSVMEENDLDGEVDK